VKNVKKKFSRRLHRKYDKKAKKMTLDLFNYGDLWDKYIAWENPDRYGVDILVSTREKTGSVYCGIEVEWKSLYFGKQLPSNLTTLDIAERKRKNLEHDYPVIHKVWNRYWKHYATVMPDVMRKSKTECKNTKYAENEPFVRVPTRHLKYDDLERDLDRIAEYHKQHRIFDFIPRNNVGCSTGSVC